MIRDEGLRLQQLFKSRGMTGRDIAKAVGVTPSAISKWVNGENGLTKKRCALLAKALGMTENDLLKAIKGTLCGFEELIVKYKVENGNYSYFDTAGRIIRCKDCLHWQEGICQRFGPDGYCSKGRRIEE